MRKPHKDIRAAALKSAEMIVVEEGLGALNARRVAAEADCSVGTLYNIFGQLDGLIDAVNLTTLRLLAEEVAEAVFYFASAASGYTTGQVLGVDGGAP